MYIYIYIYRYVIYIYIYIHIHPKGTSDLTMSTNTHGRLTIRGCPEDDGRRAPAAPVQQPFFGGYPPKGAGQEAQIWGSPKNEPVKVPTRSRLPQNSD